jgi:hypothetical protein
VAIIPATVTDILYISALEYPLNDKAGALIVVEMLKVNIPEDALLKKQACSGFRS